MANPYLQNLIPEKDSSDVVVSSNVILEIVEPDDGVDASSVVIRVNGLIVWEDDAEEIPLSFGVTKAAITDGYRYTIDPVSDFSKNTYIQIYAYAESISGTLSTTYQFSTELELPTISAQDPAPDETDVHPSTTISFHVGAATASADADVISINGVVAWLGGMEQNGFVVDVTSWGNGFSSHTYTITPPSQLPDGETTVWILAIRNGDIPGMLEESYSFTVLNDVEPPRVINISPQDGTSQVPTDRPIVFSIADDHNVDLAETLIRVRGEVVFDGSAWSSGWEGSRNVVNGRLHGYDFVVVPGTGKQWTTTEYVAVTVTTRDTSGNETIVSWSFTAGGGPRPFPTTPLDKSMYPMLLRSVAVMDRKSPSIIEQLITDAGGLDDVWNTAIFDRLSKLPSMQDPDSIPDEWLPWLKSIVGFTREMLVTASEDEWRSVLRNAVAYWNAKPSESAVMMAIRIVTGNKFRVRNFFDYRMEADWTYVTEQLEDFDPYVLDFQNPSTTGSLLTATNGSRLFSIDDLPFGNGVFRTSDEFRWLQILDCPTDQSIRGTYEIEHLEHGSNWGRIHHRYDEWPGSVPLAARWRLLGDNSDYVTEIRIVDSDIGRERINRELLRFLLDQVRPSGERIDIVYVRLLDEFIVPDLSDLNPSGMSRLGQWWTQGGAGFAATVPAPGGRCVIPNTNAIFLKVGNQASADPWGINRMVVVKLDAEKTETEAHVYSVQDTTGPGAYYIKVNWITQTVGLYKYVGSETQIGSDASIPWLTVGVPVVLRIEVERDGATPTNHIRVKADGELMLDETDNAIVSSDDNNCGVLSSWAGGSCDGAVYVSYFEIMSLPADIDRVGPNP